MEKTEKKTKTEGIILRPSQLEAIEWMKTRESASPYGGILADQVGAGKTFTVAGFLKESPLWPVLILVPKSLVWQWVGVLNDSEMDVDIHVISTAKKSGSSKKVKENNNGLDFMKLIVATHGCLLDPPEAMMNRSWGRIIVDEAHCAKNPKSLTSRNLVALRAHAKWALTATPVQNCREDLLAIAKAVGIVSEDPKFVREMFVHQTFSIGEKLHQNTENSLGDLAHAHAPKGLFVTTVNVPLTSEQEIEAYQDATKLLAKVGIALDSKDEDDDADDEDSKETERDDSRCISTKDGYGSNMNMCRMAFLRCRQASTHPALYYESMASSNANVHGMEFRLKAERAIAVPAIEVSSKIRYLVDDVLAHPDQASIVFCEWSSEMALIVDALRAGGAKAFSYQGKLSVTEREDVLSRFRKAAAKKAEPTALVAQIKCASAGLNLQCACRAYFMRPQWNPASERQAIGRLHRSGQERDVHVIRLVATTRDSKTVDEMALGKQLAKLKCITEVMEDDEMERVLFSPLSVSKG